MYCFKHTKNKRKAIFWELFYPCPLELGDLGLWEGQQVSKMEGLEMV